MKPNAASVPWNARPHQRRVEFLVALGALSGCHAALGGQLPDGTRPDVLMASPHREILFVGDAKDSERPGCGATRIRLRNYVDWIAAHCSAGRTGIFSICFGRRADAAGWARLIVHLARGSGIAITEAGVMQFDPDTWMAWFVAQPAGHSGTTGPFFNLGYRGVPYLPSVC